MYHMTAPEILSGAIETACYLSTLLVALISYLLTLRFKDRRMSVLSFSAH